MHFCLYRRIKLSNQGTDEGRTKALSDLNCRYIYTNQIKSSIVILTVLAFKEVPNAQFWKKRIDSDLIQFALKINSMVKSELY